MIGALVVAVISLGASGLNLLVQMVLAYRFGAGVEVDGYAFALSVPLFCTGLLGSIISYTVVPLVAVSASDGARQSALCASLAALGVVLALAILLAGIPAGSLQPKLLPTGSPLAVLPGTWTMILLAWTFAGSQLLVSMATAQLNGIGRPVIAALLTLPPSIGALIALLLPPLADARAAIIGMFAGSAFAAGMGFWMLRALISGTKTRTNIRADLFSLLSSSIWAVLALSCFSSCSAIDAYWGSRIGPGGLASMAYSQRVIVGFGSLVAAGPSALVVPRLARHAGNEDYSAFKSALRSILATTWLGAGLLVAILWIAAEPIVDLLFGRGAFDARDIARVAATVRHMLPGLLGMLSAVFLLRALFCLPGTGRIAALGGLLWTASYFVLSGLFLGRGTIGLADAYSLSWTGTCAGLLFYTLFSIDRLSKRRIER